jgi:DNA repair protein RadC
MRLPVYKLKLVRDHWATYPEAPFTRPELAALFFHRLIGQAACEHAAALFLDCHRMPLGATIIAVGSLVRVPMLGREVYKSAVAANAAGLLLAHNHPSGSLVPSPQDLRVTRRLQQAGELLGIMLLDHFIVTPSAGQFTSLREAGLLVGTESTVANSKNSSGPCGANSSG